MYSGQPAGTAPGLLVFFQPDNLTSPSRVVPESESWLPGNKEKEVKQRKMPTYIYKPLGKGCQYCKGGFEVKQNITDKSIEKCPKCGAAVKKVPTTFTFHSK